MKNGILIGTAFGMIIGALLVNNNARMRDMVSCTQERVENKLKQCKDAIMKKDCGCGCADESEQQSNQQNQNTQNSESSQSDYLN